MSDQSLEPAGSDYGLVSHIASRTTPLHSVALRVMNILSNRLLLKPIIPIDNPHRGSGDLLGGKDVQSIVTTVLTRMMEVSLDSQFS